MLTLLLLVACSPPTPPSTGGDPAEDSGDVAGADSGDSGDTSDTGDTAGVERWNVLVYMDGDNNLESYVTHDLNELEAAHAGDAVTVFVQADRIEGNDASDGDWTGTRRYRIEADADEEAVSSPVVEDLGEVDMGDPATLAAFIAWVDDSWPADHTVLSLWDHGDGWTMTGAPPPSIASDDTSGSGISIAEGELHAALQPHVDTFGTFDLLAFDACYMGSWEVADSLRGQVDTLVASEAWVGGEGIMYTPMLERLRDDPAMDSATLGITMAEDAVFEGRELTFGAVDITALGDVTAAVDTLGQWGLASAAATRMVLDGREASRGADADWGDYYHDLRDLAAVMAVSDTSPSELAALSAATASALDGAVLAAHGNETYAWTGGLSIYFSVYGRDAVTNYHEAPGATWSQATAWDDYLLAAWELEHAQAVR